MTPRTATPNAPGLQVDPSVAVTPSGQRLVAATNTDGPTVDVWQPDTNAPGVNTTWSHATAADTNGPVAATHPALAWDGGVDADLVTAPPQTCGGGDVKLQTWKYHVGSNTLDYVADIPTLAAGHVESWPQAVLGSTGSTVAGSAITVYDEQNCATGGHQIVLALEGALGLPLAVAPGRMPAVSVLGTAMHNAMQTTALQIAYLGEPSNGQQDVLSITCWLGAFGGLPLLDCQSAPDIVDNNIVQPGQVTSGGTALTPLAAPDIACASGSCNVVWTEGAGGNRTRVYLSRATVDPGMAASDQTSWSGRLQVSSAAGNSASQLMPSVTAQGSRVDVVYVDTRGPAAFDAFQTSFAGAVRGLDTSLTNSAGYTPGAGAVLGDRSDAASFGAKGTVYGYFPGQVTAEPPAVIEGQVDHGTVGPKLTVASGDLITGKNKPVTVGGMVSTGGLAWLSYTDTDGDPVTFTVDPPAHGTVSGNTYTPAFSYAGPDAITVRAVEAGGPTVQATHNLTITNQAPVFDPPQPATVDEGGEVVVPLHATDADVGDVVNFSVMGPAPAPFNVAGRATIDGNGDLHLTIPVGVRTMAPVTLMIRAADTTTGPGPAGFDQQSIDITVRANLKTPVIKMVDGNVTSTGRRAAIVAPVAWSDIAASCLAAGTCHTRRIWKFGDGTADVITMDAQSVDHVFPRPGDFRGQVFAEITWGTSQVTTAPQAFTVHVVDDGRLVYKLVPTVRKTPTRRFVTVKVTSTVSGTVNVTLMVKGVGAPRQALHVVAGRPATVRFSFPLKKAKTRRGTIRLEPTGLAGGNPTSTDVTRTFRF